MKQMLWMEPLDSRDFLSTNVADFLCGSLDLLHCRDPLVYHVLSFCGDEEKSQTGDECDADTAAQSYLRQDTDSK